MLASDRRGDVRLSLWSRSGMKKNDCGKKKKIPAIPAGTPLPQRAAVSTAPLCFCRACLLDHLDSPKPPPSLGNLKPQGAMLSSGVRKPESLSVGSQFSTFFCEVFFWSRPTPPKDLDLRQGRRRRFARKAVLCTQGREAPGSERKN